MFEQMAQLAGFRRLHHQHQRDAFKLLLQRFADGFRLLQGFPGDA